MSVMRHTNIHSWCAVLLSVATERRSRLFRQSYIAVKALLPRFGSTTSSQVFPKLLRNI